MVHFAARRRIWFTLQPGGAYGGHTGHTGHTVYTHFIPILLSPVFEVEVEVEVEVQVVNSGACRWRTLTRRGCSTSGSALVITTQQSLWVGPAQGQA